MAQLRFDEVGIWTEVKEEIISKYAKAYSSIMVSRFHHIFIDGFCGSGLLISKSRKIPITGSPLRVLETDPNFREYHFIDQDPVKINFLQTLIGSRKDVTLYCEDCNHVLVHSIFPRIRFEERKRALCLLDPYGVHLSWEVIRMAAEMGTIELFVNFPVSAMNRTVLWKNPEGIDVSDVRRMNAYWGETTWPNECYSPGLFDESVKDCNDRIAHVFRRRLKETAGFAFVPEPLPMRNSKNSTMYYLFFAAQHITAQTIVEDIFDRYRRRGMIPNGT